MPGKLFNTVLKARSASDAPVITTGGTLPGGTVDSVYNESLAADNDVDRWVLDEGELPPGLSLSLDGDIVGTPTEAGTFLFVIRAEGPGGLVGKEFSLTISEA